MDSNSSCTDISFLFATLLEAQETIHQLCGSQAGKDRWVFPHGEIIITGMGKASSIEFCPVTQFWVNLGVAGAFSEDFSVGDFVWVKSVSAYEQPISASLLDIQTYFCPIPEVKLFEKSIVSAHLYTAHIPVYEIPAQVEKQSLVDMEGLFLAEQAKGKKAKLLIGKIISDHCSKDSSRLIRERLPELSKKLAFCAQSIVNAWHERRLLSSH